MAATLFTCLVAVLIAVSLSSPVPVRFRKLGPALFGVNVSSAAQFSGYAVVNSTCEAGLYFWLAKSNDGNPRAPVSCFLNGGPGSSSFLGWLFEGVGPYVLNGTSVVANANSWNAHMDVLIFDQPAGVGYSYVNGSACYPTNLAQSSAQLAAAFEGIFSQPGLGLAGKPLTVVGESYGGTWVPMVARALLSSSVVKLSGIALGDGWVDPLLQQSTYSLFAYMHGLISGAQRAEADLLFQDCAAAIMSSRGPTPSSVNDVCNLVEAYIVNVSSINIYDVRTTSQYDFSPLVSLLNRPDVVSALGVDARALPYAPDSNDIGNIFAVGEQNSYAHVVAELLNRNVSVLLYNGVYDMDCNYVGTDAWVGSMAWKNASDFALLGRQPYVLQNQTVGMWRAILPLQQIVLYNSGHLVPYNVGPVAKAMIENFVFQRK